MSASIRKFVREALKRTGVEVQGFRNRGETSLAGMTAVWREPRDANTIRGAFTRVSHPRGEAQFFIASERDYIQRHLLNGSFYEIEELELIARHFRGGTFVDVGANIGNHAVFASKFLGADKIIAFEPNPHAADLLEINLTLNSAVFEVRRVGLSDQAGSASINVPENNLGGGRLTVVDDAAQGALRLSVGDIELGGETPSFVKIDTEGFELVVLRGLIQTFERCRPDVFVEVEPANRSAVDTFMAEMGYEQIEEFVRHPPLTNILYSAERPGAHHHRKLSS